LALLIAVEAKVQLKAIALLLVGIHDWRLWWWGVLLRTVPCRGLVLDLLGYSIMDIAEDVGMWLLLIGDCC
jgi:hypothetical protein